MARKQSLKSTGKLVVLDHESRILADNPFHDPTLRKLAVWLPPGYDDGTARGKSSGRGRRYPVLWDLVGYTGSGLAHVGWRPFDENVPERAARLMVAKGIARNYQYTLQSVKEIGYPKWREYDPEDTIRYYALRLYEAQVVRSTPQKIIAENTDWRFLNELKEELKT